MPTKNRILANTDTMGGYSHGEHATFLAQGASSSASYLLPVYFVAPYVAGVYPGRGIESPAIRGTSQAHIVRSVYLTVETLVSGTGSGGAGATGKLLIYRAAASAVTVASLAFDTGTDLAAQTPTALTLSTTPANLYVRFGDLLVFNWLQGGTGLALTEGMIQIDLL